MNFRSLTFICFALVGAVAASAQQALAIEVTFRDGLDGYAGTEDTELQDGFHENSNFGIKNNLDIGVFVNTTNGNKLPRRQLHRFDLTSLATDFPTGFTVNSATLRLTTSSAGTGGQNFSDIINLHLLDDANAGWVEGISNGYSTDPVAQTGETTWNRRNHFDPISDPSATRWAGSTGASSPGVDFAAIPRASTTIGTLGANSDIDFALTGDLSFINTWANGGTNAGFLLKYADEDIAATSLLNIRASEVTGPANELRRPQLILDVEAATTPDGDFDFDTDVDGADFIKWQRDLGDATNLGLWESNFGTGVGTIAAVHAVPEPSSMLLVALATLSFSFVSVSRFRIV